MNNTGITIPFHLLDSLSNAILRQTIYNLTFYFGFLTCLDLSDIFEGQKDYTSFKTRNFLLYAICNVCVFSYDTKTLPFKNLMRRHLCSGGRKSPCPSDRVGNIDNLETFTEILLLEIIPVIALIGYVNVSFSGIDIYVSIITGIL